MERLQDIRELYHLNRQRLLSRPDPAAFAAHDSKLRDAVEVMSAKRDEQLSRKDLPAARPWIAFQKGTVPFSSNENWDSPPLIDSPALNEHGEGLTIFIEHPAVPMDNNRTERTQRGPVVGRKNFYGSGALWSGKLAALLFSVLATLKLQGINPRQWLTRYLEACAAAGGKVPENVADFLPWNRSEEVKTAMRAPFCSKPEVYDTS